MRADRDPPATVAAAALAAAAPGEPVVRIDDYSDARKTRARRPERGCKFGGLGSRKSRRTYGQSAGIPLGL